MKSWAWAGGACGVLALAGCASSDCWFRGIGDLSGGFSYPGQSALSSADDVSGDGGKVVGYGTGDDVIIPNEIKQAVGWTRPLSGPPFFPGKAKGLVGLGYLVPPGNPAESYSGGISENGDVAVGYSTSSPSGKDLPVRWTDAGIEELPLPTGDDDGQAIDASFDGSLLVGFTTKDPDPKSELALRQAVVWTRDSLLYDAVVLPLALPGTGANAAQAHGISRYGSAIAGVVYDTTAGGRGSAFWPVVWTPDPSGGYVLQGLLGPGGALAHAWPSEISGDGLVVVGSVGVFPDNRACRWVRPSASAPFGPAELLGSLPGETSSYATASSANGQAIVGVSVHAEGLLPFLWDPAAKMRALRPILVAHGTPPPPGWMLETALSISADASTVVGTGANDHGDPEGWVFHCGSRADPTGWMHAVAQP